MKRQRVRKFIQLSSFLLFPITIFYFSPYLIYESALQHVINGSFIVFILLLIGATFGSRVFCGYVCPMGALQECTFLVNDKPLKRNPKYKSKFIIWALWLSGLVITHLLVKGQYRVDFFFETDHGISIHKIFFYIVYYIVIVAFFGSAVLFGKRFACHYFCWMAPFMIIGEKIGQKLHIPQIHIKANKDACISCHKCSKNCPMSIDVVEHVKTGKIKDTECIQCGACVDNCPKKVLSYAMGDVTINTETNKAQKNIHF